MTDNLLKSNPKWALIIGVMFCVLGNPGFGQETFNEGKSENILKMHSFNNVATVKENVGHSVHVFKRKNIFVQFLKDYLEVKTILDEEAKPFYDNILEAIPIEKLDLVVNESDPERDKLHSVIFVLIGDEYKISGSKPTQQILKRDSSGDINLTIRFGLEYPRGVFGGRGTTPKNTRVTLGGDARPSFFIYVLSGEDLLKFDSKTKLVCSETISGYDVLIAKNFASQEGDLPDADLAIEGEPLIELDRLSGTELEDSHASCSLQPSTAPGVADRIWTVPREVLEDP